MAEGCAFHRARISANMTIADVARAVGVTRAAVAHWDKGLAYPRAEMALKLAELLEIDASHLRRDHARNSSGGIATETISDIFADARRRLSTTLGVPTNRIKLTLSIDG